jgi:Lamin Tail Domain
MVWVWVTAQAADVVINELLADVAGTDEGREWVEVYNRSTEAVSLAGWTLESGTQSYAERFRFDEVVLAPGSWLVLGGPDVKGADLLAPELTLGNAGSSADAVRLVDASGTVVDTVVYGTPNSDGFADDAGPLTASLAPPPAEDQTLARSPDGADSDQGTDFVLASPTLGGPNPAPVVCGPPAAVRINEILPDPGGDDSGHEWVELFNADDVPAELGGWTLELVTSGLSEPGSWVFPATQLAAGAFLVVGGDQVAPDLVMDRPLGNGTETDGVRLLSCDQETTDTVLYGEAPNADDVLDDLGRASEPYGAPGTDQSLARWVDGEDTDTSLDWRVLVVPTPGESNPRAIGSAVEGELSPGCGSPEGSRGCGSRPQTPSVEAPAAGGLSIGLLVLVRRRRSAHLLANASSWGSGDRPGSK